MYCGQCFISIDLQYLICGTKWYKFLERAKGMVFLLSGQITQNNYFNPIDKSIPM